MLTAREMESLAKATSELIRDATAPLLARIEKLESTTIRDGVDGKDGRDGTDGKSLAVEDVLPQLQARLVEIVDEFPKPQDGKDGTSVTVEDVVPLIEARMAEWELDFERRASGRLESAIARIPIPKDGKDGEVRHEQVAKAVAEYIDAHPIQMPKDGKDGVDGADGSDGAPGADGKPGADGRDGVDGKSITVEDVLPAVMERVQKTLDAIPRPKDGRDGIDGVDGKDGAPGVNGKDGTSVTIEQIKSVIESYSAEWALDFEKRAHDILQRTIDRMPKPKDGKDGRDALDIDSFDAELSEDGRTVTLSLGRGDLRKSASLHMKNMIYRQVWKQGEAYLVGDTVTYDGSTWVCVKDTKSKPGEYNSDWRLCVKKGRNGRDFEPSKVPE